MKLGKRGIQFVVGAAICALLGAGAFVALRPTAPAAAPVAQAAEVEQFVAEAVVVPRQEVDLAFAAPGLVVDEINVKAGDQVKAGQALARLDTRGLELQVAEARAALAQAQASYDALIADASPADLAQAQAQIAQAQAQLVQARGGVTAEDAAAARAQLDQARAALNELEAGPEATDVARARAALEQAQADLESQRDSLSAAKTNAQISQAQAADALVQAQSRYTAALRDWDHVERNGDDPVTGRGLNDIQKQQFRDTLVQAEASLRSAESAVAQAGVAYEAAQRAEVTGIAGAEARVRDAQAALDDLFVGAKADERAAARAQVAQAEANLARLSGEERAGSLDAAGAAVTQAQAGYEQLVSEPKFAEIARAKAQIEQAEVAVESAKLTLEEATLRAPFDAVVADVNVTVGEVPGTQEAAVSLSSGDWKIETTDLTELQVVDVQVGDAAAITFDALPGVALRGTVDEIAAIGERKQGDITYTVVVTPEEPDARLRWNMTAAVSFPK